jgi:hypothetical protein
MGRVSSTGPSLSQSTRAAGLYVQNARQVGRDLLVTAGIRYDLQSSPGIRADINNVSPELGFAWSPLSKGTVLRAGFGVNYERMPLPIMAGSADPSMPANLSRSISISGLGNQTLASYGNFQTVSPSIQNAYAQHATLEAEQEIGKKSSLVAQYQFVRGVQLALPVQRTAALCSSTSACAAGNDFTGQQIGSGAVSTYSGLSLAFTQQPTRWGSYRVAYTYSKAEGNGTGANSSYLSDQMRRASVTGTLHTSLEPAANNWQRVTHGFLLTGTADYLNRSEFLGMNFVNMNARLSKNLVAGPKFQLEAMAETFNMLQRTNGAFTKARDQMGDGANQIFASYRRVATAQSPNGTQAGLKLSF